MYNVSLKKCLFPNNLIETMWQDDTDYLLFLIIVEVKYFSAYTTFNHIIVLPVKIVRLRSNNQMPELENEIYDQKINKGKFFTGKKNYDVIESRIGREILNFDYDEKEQIVSIILPHGFNQIVWE